MSPSVSNLCFVIVPGGALTPAHYGYLEFLLMKAGHPVMSAKLPSMGTQEARSAQDDTDYVRNSMILPVLDHEEHDVVVISHSYSGMPAGAAAAGLSPRDRAIQGRKTAVLGQIYIAAILPRGGDGINLLTTFGGQLPPHMTTNEADNLVLCADPIPPLMQDVEGVFAKAAAASCVKPCLTSYQTPCPRASWDELGYQGRLAYIKTTQDQAIPFAVQEMLLQGTGQEWTTRSIDTGHCPQLSKPEELSQLILELAHGFMVL